VLAEKPGRRIAIQAKRYDGGVGNAAVQQVFAGMAHHKCQRCVVVSTSHFSRGAVELAQSTGCVLVGRDEIPALVRGELGF
jgi:HJR/Mrr/RecB family endonuclease